MHALGVSTRAEAARLLAEAEGRRGYEPLIYQSPHVAPAEALKKAEPVDQGEWPQGREPGRKLMEEQAPYVPAPPRLPTGVRLPLPEMRGVRNDLGPGARVGWIIAIAVIAVFAFGIFLAGLEALGKLGWSETQPLNHKNDRTPSGAEGGSLC